MDWDQKESVIKEKRTIEATKKNLTGPAGKLGIIVKVLGHPIIRQGNSLMDVNYLEDAFDDFSNEEYETTASNQKGPLVYKDEILDMTDDFVTQCGYVFDGLSRGIHIEIQYIHSNNELKVHYKGYLVFQEIAGDLEAYAPTDEWEEIIDRLYYAAKKDEKKMKEFYNSQIAVRVQDAKMNFWERVKTKWGL